jgi:proteasome-associated ATPase
MKARSVFGDTGWGVSAGLTKEQRLEREVEELNGRLRSLEAEPTTCGLVVGLEERNGISYATIRGGAGTIEAKLGSWAAGITVGMTVRMHGDRPTSFFETSPAGAYTAKVDAIHEGWLEFTVSGESRAAASGIPCKVGDRVMLDAGGQVVLRNLGPATAARAFTGDTGVSWDDIGGLEEAKRALREAIEEPVTHAAVYARYGKKPVRGIALWGVAGTGKTMLAKAAATSLAKAHGKTASSSGFIYVKGPEILAGILGSSEGNVRALFASARAHHAEHGYPAIVFLDEADGILGRRGGLHEGVERTIVPQFLAEMDGLDETGALIILATNRLDAIDPAFLRKGRIDRHIEIALPSKEACVDIFAKCLRGRPAPAKLAAQAAEELFAPRHVLGMVGDGKTRQRITLADMVSGAMVAGVVEMATQRALRRAIAGQDDGITLADVKAAVADVVVEQKGVIE